MKGRSLWIDAWNRLRSNRAAIISAVYLMFIVLLTVVGPNFTGHEFTTQYPSYVRVPPSFASYPKADKLDQEIKEIVARAHLNFKEWKEVNGRFFVTVASDKMIDDRVTRYLDRSDSFKDGKVESKSVDGLEMTNV